MVFKINGTVGFGLKKTLKRSTSYLFIPKKLLFGVVFRAQSVIVPYFLRKSMKIMLFLFVNGIGIETE